MKKKKQSRKQAKSPGKIKLPGKIHRGLPKAKIGGVPSGFERVETVVMTTDSKGHKRVSSGGASIRPVRSFGPNPASFR